MIVAIENKTMLYTLLRVWMRNSHTPTQIMMMNLIPNIDKALSLVIKQEREMNSVVSTIIPSIRNNEEIITLSAQASHDAQHGKPN